MQSSVHEIVFTAGRPPRVPAKPAASRRTATNKKKAKAKAENEVVLVAHANSTQRVQSKIYNLTLDVNNLKQQVASLETYRSILYARALVSQYDLDGSILKKVKQYFNVFHRGYHTRDRRPAALLNAIADEDLSLGITGFGRDMLLEQWRRYTEYFGMRRCDVPVAHILPGTKDEEWEQDDKATITVRASLTFQGSFTPTALALVFPAVLEDPDLTQELLDKDFSADAVFHLHFNKSGMIVRHDVDTDFFAVLANALDDPVRAAEIMQVVGVAEESMLADPDLVDDREDVESPFLEPVERVAQTKRTRFAVVTDDDNNSGEDEESPEPRDAVTVEPDAEPTARGATVDTRHSLDFLLS